MKLEAIQPVNLGILRANILPKKSLKSFTKQLGSGAGSLIQLCTCLRLPRDDHGACASAGQEALRSLEGGAESWIGLSTVIQKGLVTFVSYPL